MMYKLRVAAMLVLFMAVAITGGCQKDDEISIEQTVEGTINVSTISFDEFKADMKAYDELQNAVRSAKSKSGAMHQDGFFYNTDDVTMISYTGYKTYTFPIYRDDDKGVALENLVIRVPITGTTDSYIFQYDLTPGEIQDVYNGKPIINLSRKTWVTRTNGGDEDSIIYQDGSGNCYVYAGDYYQDADNLVWFNINGVSLRFERIECPEGHNNYTLIQDGQSNGGSSSSGSGNTGNPGGSGMGSININVVIPVLVDYNPVQNPSGPSGGSWGNHPNRPVITRPAVSLFYKLFFDELTKHERMALMLNPDLADGLSDLIAGPLEGWPDRRDLANDIFDFAMMSQANRDKATLLLDYYNENESNDTMDLIEWAVDFWDDNPDITVEEFENWFLETPEATTDTGIIDPNLITYDSPVTQENLPTFNNFFFNFPKNTNSGYYVEMPASEVYNLVGGTLLTSYNATPNQYANACSIRGSRGLLYSGINIPVLNYNNSQRTQKGADNKNYILDAVSFDKFMTDKFGSATYELTGADANDSEKVKNLLKGKKGIYVIINNSPGQAGYSGHVDAIYNGICLSGSYTKPKGGVKSIRIWELE